MGKFPMPALDLKRTPGRRWSTPLHSGLGFLLFGWPAFATSISLLSSNIAGIGQIDWSTDSTQAQAIGRIVEHLDTDIITFQEMPFLQSNEMTNFVAACLEGFHLARYSGTDGILRNAILSRFPIKREQKWLYGGVLNDFGYDGRFTRDPFDAEIEVPD